MGRQLTNQIKNGNDWKSRVIKGTYYKLRPVLMRLIDCFESLLFLLFSIFPLKNKVVGSNFSGRSYGDNTKEILDKLHQINANTEIICACRKGFEFDCPDYVKKVYFTQFNRIKLIYHYATAKVWIDTHLLGAGFRKRKNQLFIDTWHGGLGIKKIGFETNNSKEEQRKIKRTTQLADMFISNSDHLTNVYHEAFHYYGKILKCGYPKNDEYICPSRIDRNAVLNKIGVDSNKKCILYAPTFRERVLGQKYSEGAYLNDYEAVIQSVEKRFGGEFVFLLRLHPVHKLDMIQSNASIPNVIDVTDYPDIQDLIMISDVMISDYSSCIFDGALREIPCFLYASDYEQYKENHGLYYTPEELPFPFSKSVKELQYQLESYDETASLNRWSEFKKRVGVVENGNAALTIAQLIDDYM